MSLDYPDRRKWLAVRATPKRRPVIVLHTSARILPSLVGPVIEKPGHTYRRARA
jgi:hypothetical protein